MKNRCETRRPGRCRSLLTEGRCEQGRSGKFPLVPSLPHGSCSPRSLLWPLHPHRLQDPGIKPPPARELPPRPSGMDPPATPWTSPSGTPSSATSNASIRTWSWWSSPSRIGASRLRPCATGTCGVPWCELRNEWAEVVKYQECTGSLWTLDTPITLLMGSTSRSNIHETLVPCRYSQSH